MEMELGEGEPPAGPWTAQLIETLVRMLLGSAATPEGRPRLVAVDGRGGAGKSTLVRRLQEAVPNSAVVHTDDVAWHHSFFDWTALLQRAVLEPLRRGGAVAYRPATWQERGRAGSIVVPAGLDAVWIEGTGSSRRELAALIDASVWVQSDVVEAERRLVARDGDDPAEVNLRREWQQEEVPFLRQDRPWDRATAVVAGTTDVPHDPATQVVVAPPPRWPAGGGRPPL